MTWARDGRHIFFRDRGRGFMMAAEITVTPDLTAGAPRELFPDSSYSRAGIFANYDISADGRFLMMKIQNDPITEFHVIPNWFDQLKRIVPRIARD